MHRVDPLIENGSFIGIVAISTDITEIVASRQQAQEANMAKNQFLANISHEIRTPMIGILGAVDLLEESNLSHIQQENVRIIRSCGEQLLGLINDILDTSKIELDLMELHPTPCDLLSLFSRLLNNIEPLLNEKGLKIKLNISPNMPVQVLVDETKLQQILTNLFHNAIKFTNRGYIRFTAFLEQVDKVSWLSIAICDTGIGIPDYEVENIFNPFTQVDNSNSRQYGGIGLGLYLCKKLVDLMQGKIQLSSQTGLGTNFLIKIPVDIVSSLESNYKVSDQYPDDCYMDNLLLDFNPTKVLLVEDNELNQKIVYQMLIKYGFEVSLANNGLDCLRIMQKTSYDIILMDMQMPVMDGYEATRMIRQYEDYKNIPIIAMTAYAMAGDREKCLANGCTSYIAKPFKAEQLAREIRQVLGTKNTIKNIRNPEFKSFINDLLPEFMPQLAEMIEELKLAVEKHDLSLVKSISHDIKGTAGMYGFTKISNTAAHIEDTARNNTLIEVKSELDKLLELFKQASIQVG
jgi:K+-sensing histidine kinase KdpD